MNYKVVGKFISQILAVEAAFMLPALIISAACQNLNAVIGFIVSIVIILGIASLHTPCLTKKISQNKV